MHLHTRRVYYIMSMHHPKKKLISVSSLNDIESVFEPNTPTSDFFNLHGTVQTSLDKVTTKINSSYSTLSNFLQGQRQKLTTKNENGVNNNNTLSKNSSVQSSSLCQNFPNADDVLQELDEYFKLEDTAANKSGSNSSLVTNIDFTQIGTDDSYEINLEKLEIDELQKICSNFKARTHRINDHLVQALAQRDDESIKHEIYQGIINVINQLGVVYHQSADDSSKIVYVPKDLNFKHRGIIELKKFLDLLCSIYEDSPESARLLAKYVLQCSEGL